MASGGRAAGSRRWACGMALGLAVVAGAQESPPPERVIRYDKDLLTVHVVGAPVLDVLAEVGRQSGADIRGTARNGADITAQFDDVPLAQALVRVLGDQNFALIYGSGGLRAIRLLGGTGEAVMIAGTPAQTKDVAPILEQRIRVDGPVADALHSPMATLRDLAVLWLQTDDQALRDQSATDGFRAMESEPELRNSLVDFTQSHSDAELAGILRQFAGARAEELAAFIVSQTRVTELHMKAASVLQLLQAAGG